MNPEIARAPAVGRMWRTLLAFADRWGASIPDDQRAAFHQSVGNLSDTLITESVTLALELAATGNGGTQPGAPPC